MYSGSTAVAPSSNGDGSGDKSFAGYVSKLEVPQVPSELGIPAATDVLGLDLGQTAHLILENPPVELELAAIPLPEEQTVSAEGLRKLHQPDNFTAPDLYEISSPQSLNRDPPAVSQSAPSRLDGVSVQEEATPFPSDPAACHAIHADDRTDNDADDDHRRESSQCTHGTDTPSSEASAACTSSAVHPAMTKDNKGPCADQESNETTPPIKELKVKILNVLYITGLRDRGENSKSLQPARSGPMSRDSFADSARTARNSSDGDERCSRFDRSRRTRSLPPYLSCADHDSGDNNCYLEITPDEPSNDSSLSARREKKRDRSSGDDNHEQRTMRARDNRHETNSRSKLPCIFLIGEPLVFPDHTRKYDYIAQLL